MSIPLRKQAGWMSKNDERILEFLSKADSHRPREIRSSLEEDGITMRLQYTDNRLQKLEEAGMVRRESLNYQITKRGKQYLRGEFDATSIALTRF